MNKTMKFPSLYNCSFSMILKFIILFYLIGEVTESPSDKHKYGQTEVMEIEEVKTTLKRNCISFNRWRRKS